MSGDPKSGFEAQRAAMMSLISAFCPLYVVMIEILSAGYLQEHATPRHPAHMSQSDQHAEQAQEAG